MKLVNLAVGSPSSKHPHVPQAAVPIAKEGIRVTRRVGLINIKGRSRGGGIIRFREFSTALWEYLRPCFTRQISLIDNTWGCFPFCTHWFRRSWGQKTQEQNTEASRCVHARSPQQRQVNASCEVWRHEDSAEKTIAQYTSDELKLKFRTQGYTEGTMGPHEAGGGNTLVKCIS